MEEYTDYNPVVWKNDSATGPFLDADNVQRMDNGIKKAIDRTNDLIDYVGESIKEAGIKVVDCSKTKPYVDSSTYIGVIPGWTANKIAIFISDRSVGDYGKCSHVEVVKSNSGFVSIGPASGGDYALSAKISDDGKLYVSGNAAKDKVGEETVLSNYTLLTVDATTDKLTLE